MRSQRPVSVFLSLNYKDFKISSLEPALCNSWQGIFLALRRHTLVHLNPEAFGLGSKNVLEQPWCCYSHLLFSYSFHTLPDAGERSVNQRTKQLSAPSYFPPEALSQPKRVAVAEQWPLRGDTATNTAVFPKFIVS